MTFQEIISHFGKKIISACGIQGISYHVTFLKCQYGTFHKHYRVKYTASLALINQNKFSQSFISRKSCLHLAFNTHLFLCFYIFYTFHFISTVDYSTTSYISLAKDKCFLFFVFFIWETCPLGTWFLGKHVSIHCDQSLHLSLRFVV